MFDFRTIALSLLFALTMAAGHPARAVNPPAASRHAGVPLAHFANVQGPVRLPDNASTIDFSIPLAGTAEIEDAVLELHYSNSVALQAARSSLQIRFNQTTLAQIRLDPAQPSGVATIRLPRELWRPGYNTLTTAVFQHYADSCEDYEAPELWTELDLVHSVLSYSLKPLGRPYVLSDLSQLFSPGLGGVRQVEILSAPDDSAAPLLSRALPMIAQGLALRRQFDSLSIDYFPWRDGGGEGFLPAGLPAEAPQVLVGTSDQLAHILPARDQIVADGPKLALRTLPGGTPRLIVTGRTIDEVIEAARGLTVMEDRLAAEADLTFAGHQATGGMTRLLQRQYMKAGHTYQFADLGAGDTKLSGAGTNSSAINLPLPGAGANSFALDLPLAADFYTYESAMAELSLDFAYSAGMGSGSAMNVMLNGEMVHSAALDAASGASFRGYKIHLPARLMVPGINKLEFALNLKSPPTANGCTYSRGRHLFVQFLGTSSITMPAAGHAASLPDLGRFSASGFPFFSPDDGAESRLVVASPDLIGPALTLAAKLAQQSHGAIDTLTLQVGIPSGRIEGSAILLAPLGTLPPEIFAQWSAAIGRVISWPYKTRSELKLGRGNGHIDLASLLPGEPAAAKEEEEALPRLDERASTGELGIVATFRNSAASGPATLLVLSAATTPILARRIDDLVQPELWGQMRGDLGIWKDITSPMTVAAVGDSYQVGDRDRWLLLRLALSNNPWCWLAAVLVSLVLAACIAARLIRARGERVRRGEA